VVFERFTDRARKVVVLAQEEARLLDHNYIGPEHLLLGLAHEGEGVAAQALEQLGISLEAARAHVEEVIGRSGSSPSGHIPFTPPAKKVLELSLREALELGDERVSTEHILLGLVREGEGVAVQVLVKMGAEPERVRAQVMDLRGPPAEGRTSEAPTAEDLVGTAVVGARRLLDLPAEQHPGCPHCGAPLADSGAVRVLALPDVRAGHDVSAQVVYCQECGLALGVLGL
jgi:ATP-dependent Clp protease ATP-binding subunit ClpA